MSKSRLLLHPLLTNPRSRSILISFTVTVFGVSFFMWVKVMGILSEAGLSFDHFRTLAAVPLLKWLISPYVQISIALFSILAAAATTAISVVGPVKRLEQWLMDWEMGHSLSPLKPRTGDSYDNLIRLINDLYSVKKSPPRK
jgi:hypothetical protein